MPPTIIRLSTYALEVDISSKDLVILGANGSGKSTLGIEVAQSSQAIRISARRTLDLADSIPMNSLHDATKSYEQTSAQSLRNRISQQNDFGQALVLLLAHETEHGNSLLARVRAAEETRLTRQEGYTKLSQAVEVWEALFPGRRLTFNRHQPRVTQDGSTGFPAQTYGQTQMSDGEKQALYLIAKILLVSSGNIIVVDEPETHLHSALARELWDRLRALQPERKFIYITHDVPFALSRANAKLLFLHSRNRATVVDDLADLPASAIESLVGAATSSVKNSKIVLCEGTSSSLDYSILSAWYSSEDVSVVPVGSCDTVQACMLALPTSQVLAGASFLGVVDRDQRSQPELQHIKRQGIHILGVSEIEHLLVLRGVIRQIASVQKSESADAADRAIDAVRARIRQHHGSRLHIAAFEYAKEAARWQFTFPKGRLSPGSTLDEAKQSLQGGMGNLPSTSQVGNFVDDAHSQLKAVLDRGELEEMLKHLQLKGLHGLAASPLGLTADGYKSVFIGVLRGMHGDGARNSMRQVLADFLPPLAP